LVVCCFVCLFVVIDHLFVGCLGLNGANNMIVIETESVYTRDAPLVIMGPGAGARATALGILSDLLQ
jgi:homoserine dehydrogenase